MILPEQPNAAHIAAASLSRSGTFHGYGQIYKSRIRAKIAETIDRPIEKVVDDVELMDLVLSSFTLVELVVELQEEFNVQFVQEDLQDVRTVSHLIDLVDSRMGDDG